jgi:DNA mismatch endonuclease (patch repair protein)
MTDVFTKAKRSEVMSRIRSRGNRDTELALARLLHTNGITGWRRHVEITGRARSPLRAGGAHGMSRPAKDRTTLRDVPTFRVRPDFVFKLPRLAIFVDDCFWHGCPKHATKPRNNAAFWGKKLAANKRRDQFVNRMLRRVGWQVVRIWEHELQRRGAQNAEREMPTPVRRIQQAIGRIRRRRPGACRTSNIC